MMHAIKTVSGRDFVFAQPEMHDYLLSDIAHGLSHLCRFNGHTRVFYSVAQHSVLVAEQLPKEHRLAGLLHDASEAYLGDVTTPLKLLMPGYREVEDRTMRAIFSCYGLPYPMPDCVKAADLVMLVTEKRDLVNDQSPWDCEKHAAPLPQKIVPMTSAQAAAAFKAAYHKYAALQVGPR